ncbi:hypothetical protein HF1_12000 [Mycoplasma haemofelis str. Langford 1]|uniref:Uncharacterized protein n=1 Tax=Mycoplasma haemofelis (strain Langford 1) TaxID=941640 RepID=E8ZJ87_MYCHL|nr:hypothetical protein [Mycoplasma haemofelis]CBY93208.1 hypothetical protein HF1_12000 [Mycoplasma haemofelis str. Langford 1]
MSTSLASKALMGLAGAGAVGGTVAAGYKVFTKENEVPKAKKTIAQLIKDSGTKTLLTSSDSKEGTFWKEAWKSYREANKSKAASQDPWIISEFTGNYSSIQDQNAPSAFLSKCESLSREEVDDISDSRYIQVFNWCTRNYQVAASSFLDSDGKVLLTNSTAASHADWKAAWEVYRKEYKDANSRPWEIESWDTKKANEGQDAPTDFISRCDTESKVLVTDKSSVTYKNLSKYCTKNKTQ